MPKIKSVDFKCKVLILQEKNQKEMGGLKVTPSAVSIIFSRSANYDRCMSCAADLVSETQGDTATRINYLMTVSYLSLFCGASSRS